MLAVAALTQGASAAAQASGAQGAQEEQEPKASVVQAGCKLILYGGVGLQPTRGDVALGDLWVVDNASPGEETWTKVHGFPGLREDPVTVKAGGAQYGYGQADPSGAIYQAEYAIPLPPPHVPASFKPRAAAPAGAVAAAVASASATAAASSPQRSGRASVASGDAPSVTMTGPATRVGAPASVSGASTSSAPSRGSSGAAGQVPFPLLQEVNAQSRVVPPPRSGHATALLGNGMFVFGGSPDSAAGLNDLWRLELSDGLYSWTRIGPLPFHTVPSIEELAAATLASVPEPGEDGGLGGDADSARLSGSFGGGVGWKPFRPGSGLPPTAPPSRSSSRPGTARLSSARSAGTPNRARSGSASSAGRMSLPRLGSAGAPHGGTGGRGRSSSDAAFSQRRGSGVNGEQEEDEDAGIYEDDAPTQSQSLATMLSGGAGGKSGRQPAGAGAGSRPGRRSSLVTGAQSPGQRRGSARVSLRVGDATYVAPRRGSTSSIVESVAGSLMGAPAGSRGGSAQSTSLPTYQKEFWWPAPTADAVLVADPDPAFATRRLYLVGGKSTAPTGAQAGGSGGGSGGGMGGAGPASLSDLMVALGVRPGSASSAGALSAGGGEAGDAASAGAAALAAAYSTLPVWRYDVLTGVWDIVCGLGAPADAASRGKAESVLSAAASAAGGAQPIVAGIREAITAAAPGPRFSAIALPVNPVATAIPIPRHMDAYYHWLVHLPQALQVAALKQVMASGGGPYGAAAAMERGLGPGGGRRVGSIRGGVTFAGVGAGSVVSGVEGRPMRRGGAATVVPDDRGSVATRRQGGGALAPGGKEAALGVGTPWVNDWRIALLHKARSAFLNDKTCRVDPWAALFMAEPQDAGAPSDAQSLALQRRGGSRRPGSAASSDDRLSVRPSSREGSLRSLSDISAGGVGSAEACVRRCGELCRAAGLPPLSDGGIQYLRELITRTGPLPAAQLGCLFAATLRAAAAAAAAAAGGQSPAADRRGSVSSVVAPPPAVDLDLLPWLPLPGPGMLLRDAGLHRLVSVAWRTHAALVGYAAGPKSVGQMVLPNPSRTLTQPGHHTAASLPSASSGSGSSRSSSSAIQAATGGSHGSAAAGSLSWAEALPCQAIVRVLFGAPERATGDSATGLRGATPQALRAGTGEARSAALGSGGNPSASASASPWQAPHPQLGHDQLLSSSILLAPTALHTFAEGLHTSRPGSTFVTGSPSTAAQAQLQGHVARRVAELCREANAPRLIVLGGVQMNLAAAAAGSAAAAAIGGFHDRAGSSSAVAPASSSFALLRHVYTLTLPSSAGSGGAAAASGSFAGGGIDALAEDPLRAAGSGGLFEDVMTATRRRRRGIYTGNADIAGGITVAEMALASSLGVAWLGGAGGGGGGGAASVIGGGGGSRRFGGAASVVGGGDGARSARGSVSGRSAGAGSAASAAAAAAAVPAAWLWVNTWRLLAPAQQAAIELARHHDGWTANGCGLSAREVQTWAAAAGPTPDILMSLGYNGVSEVHAALQQRRRAQQGGPRFGLAGALGPAAAAALSSMMLAARERDGSDIGGRPDGDEDAAGPASTEARKWVLLQLFMAAVKPLPHVSVWVPGSPAGGAAGAARAAPQQPTRNCYDPPPCIADAAADEASPVFGGSGSLAAVVEEEASPKRGAGLPSSSAHPSARASGVSSVLHAAAAAAAGSALPPHSPLRAPAAPPARRTASAEGQSAGLKAPPRPDQAVGASAAAAGLGLGSHGQTGSAAGASAASKAAAVAMTDEERVADLPWDMPSKAVPAAGAANGAAGAPRRRLSASKFGKPAQATGGGSGPAGRPSTRGSQPSFAAGGEGEEMGAALLDLTNSNSLEPFAEQPVLLLPLPMGLSSLRAGPGQDAAAAAAALPAGSPQPAEVSAAGASSEAGGTAAAGNSTVPSTTTVAADEIGGIQEPAGPDRRMLLQSLGSLRRHRADEEGGFAESVHKAVPVPKRFQAVGTLQWDGVAVKRGFSLAELPDATASLAATAAAANAARLSSSAAPGGVGFPQPSIASLGGAVDQSAALPVADTPFGMAPQSFAALLLLTSASQRSQAALGASASQPSLPGRMAAAGGLSLTDALGPTASGKPLPRLPLQRQGGAGSRSSLPPPDPLSHSGHAALSSSSVGPLPGGNLTAARSNHVSAASSLFTRTGMRVVPDFFRQIPSAVAGYSSTSGPLGASALQGAGGGTAAFPDVRSLRSAIPGLSSSASSPLLSGGFASTQRGKGGAAGAPFGVAESPTSPRLRLKPMQHGSATSLGGSTLPPSSPMHGAAGARPAAGAAGSGPGAATTAPVAGLQAAQMPGMALGSLRKAMDQLGASAFGAPMPMVLTSVVRPVNIHSARKGALESARKQHLDAYGQEAFAEAVADDLPAAAGATRAGAAVRASEDVLERLSPRPAGMTARGDRSAT
jgi:hypothetical protein